MYNPIHIEQQSCMNIKLAVYIRIMKFNQVLVVYKQLTPPRVSTREFTTGQRLHLETLDLIYPLLRKKGISFESCSLSQLRTIKNVDLVITIGGDGTVLATSHFVQSQPILGIKSYGRESIGYFCAATTDTMQLYFNSLLEGHITPRKLNRLEVTIGKHKIREHALNDVLFSHSSPAATTDYILQVKNKKEKQRSSGIWVCTAAGSTAAVSAAGGSPLRLGSKKMEYIIREPYAPSIHYKMLQGIIPDSTPIKISSLTKHGTVFIDGSHIQYPASDGTKITIKASKKPLNIYWKI